MTEDGQQERTFTIPGEPIGTNRLWRKGWHGGIHVSDEARTYKQMVGVVATAAGAKQWGDLNQSRWDLSIIYYHRYPKKRKDVDAPVKLVLDGLTGVLYADDYQVLRQSSEVRHDPLNPRIEVTVREIV